MYEYKYELCVYYNETVCASLSFSNVNDAVKLLHELNFKQYSHGAVIEYVYLDGKLQYDSLVEMMA